MTWKSTAAASGAMVVATWLASHAPVGRPRAQPSTVPSAANTETAAAEIQREADRLHGRLNQVAAYKLPQRNPFRFGDRPVSAPVARQPVMTVEQIAPTPQPAPPTIRLRLAGIGEDVMGDEVIRTAIISTPENVHVVKVGETIADAYKVEKIAADAVELIRLDDGSTVQLTLKR
jgi:hypothetical protein